MRFIKTLSFLCFAFFATSAFAQSSMPSVTAKTLAGQSIDLQDHVRPGKVTFFTFWASWCTPCKKELDALADFYEDWQNDWDVEIVAITIDNARGLMKVPAIVASKDWEYTILSGVQNDMQQAFNFQSIPHSFIVNKEGKITNVHSGYVPGDEEEIEDHIREIMEH